MDNNSSSCKEAMTWTNKHHWIQAIKNKIQNFEALKVWEVATQQDVTHSRQTEITPSITNEFICIP